MDKIPCPGCRTELDFEITTCPICMRPRSKYEITRAYTALRAEQARSRKRPFKIAGGLLAVAAIGALAYRFRAPLTGAAEAARTRAALFAANATDARNLVERPAESAAPAPAPPPPLQPLTIPQAAPAPQPPPAAPKPPSDAGTPVVKAAPVPARPKQVADIPIPPFDSSVRWAVYGRVYDVITLQPVPELQLVFRASDGYAAMNAMSDMDGRYVVVLPRLSQGSFEIRTMNTQYASPVLYEPDIPYAKLARSERENFANDAQEGDMPLPPLEDVADEPSLRRDLFVAPRR